MSDESQTVVDTPDEKPEASTEGQEDARKAEPSLDELLAEFGQSTQSEAKPSTPEQKPESSMSEDDRAFLEEMRRERAQSQFRQDIAPVIQSVRESAPELEVLTDDELEDILDGKARRDPRLAQAWQDRYAQPAKWQGVIKALSADYKSRKRSQIDKNATEDREAVAAAVRGASTKAPEEAPPDYSRMPNSDFRQDVQKKYGYTPAV